MNVQTVHCGLILFLVAQASARGVFPPNVLCNCGSRRLNTAQHDMEWVCSHSLVYTAASSKAPGDSKRSCCSKQSQQATGNVACRHNACLSLPMRYSISCCKLTQFECLQHSAIPGQQALQQVCSLGLQCSPKGQDWQAQVLPEVLGPMAASPGVLPVQSGTSGCQRQPLEGLTQSQVM